MSTSDLALEHAGVRRSPVVRHGETLSSGVRGATGVTPYDPTERDVARLRDLDELPRRAGLGCVNVLDHDGERFVLRLLDFTSDDPREAGLERSAVKLLASLVRAQRGHAEDETHRVEPSGRARERSTRGLKRIRSCADTAPRDKFP